MILKKGNQVKIITGKDKGKTGEILEIDRKLNKIKIKSISMIKRSKKYHAHDEKNKFKEGEKVTIIECKPFSKKKTWQVME